MPEEEGKVWEGEMTAGGYEEDAEDAVCHNSPDTSFHASASRPSIGCMFGIGAVSQTNQTGQQWAAAITQTNSMG